MVQDTDRALSARELELLELVATGATNQQIAQELTISVNTVKAHLRNIFAKLEVESRTEATLYAIQNGLLKVPTPQTAEARPDPGQPSPTDAGIPTISAPVRWGWHMPQRIALAVTLLSVLAVAIWPRGGASLAHTSRFVDRPDANGQITAATSASRWQPETQMSLGRSRFAIAPLGTQVLIISGLTVDGWTHQTSSYLPAENRWERLADKPTAVANVGAAVVGDRVYVPGGLDPNERVLDILEIYDYVTDTWQTGSPAPHPLCAYALAPYGEGFYCFGGWDGENYMDTVYYYDIPGDAWRAAPNLGAPRADLAAAQVQDRIYVIGGFDGSHEYSLCESFSPDLVEKNQNPWMTHTPMSVGRSGHSAIAMDGIIYVVGGGWESYLDHNERYDTINNVWSAFESPELGQWRTLGLATASTRQGAFLYAFGGWNGSYLSSVRGYQIKYWVYQPITSG